MTDSIPPHPVLSLPREALKRDGRQVPFDSEKIRSALQRAGQAAGEFDADEANLLSAQVTKVLIHRFHGQPPAIEQIQDVVEQTLIAANHLKTARAYIVYREQHAKLRADRKTLVDVESSINEYLSAAGLARQRQRQPGLLAGRADPQRLRQGDANYWLSHVYAPEIGEAHREGDLHIHDLDMLAATAPAGRCAPCCTRASTACRARSRRAAAALSSAVGQMVNFLGTLQNEWAGAQAFSSFDTYLAPFIRKDGLATTRCARPSRSWSTTSTCPRAGAPRRRSPTSPSTGCARRTCASRFR
jgi:anaerobic ribonucleoside-triphosphate reductase